MVFHKPFCFCNVGMQECFVIYVWKGCLSDGCLWLITKKCQEIPCNTQWLIAENGQLCSVYLLTSLPLSGYCSVYLLTSLPLSGYCGVYLLTSLPLSGYWQCPPWGLNRYKRDRWRVLTARHGQRKEGSILPSLFPPQQIFLTMTMLLYCSAVWSVAVALARTKVSGRSFSSN